MTDRGDRLARRNLHISARRWIPNGLSAHYSVASMSSRDLFAEWAGIAAGYLDRVGMREGPIDLGMLAACYDLCIARGPRSCSCRVPGIVYVDHTLDPIRYRADLAHELAHDAMDLAGYPIHDEAAASWIGAAIELPEASFKRDLTFNHWDLDAMRALYRTSWEMTARRIADVRSAVVTVIDNGRVTSRFQSPWLNTDWGTKPTPVERLLVEEATQEGRSGSGSLAAYRVDGTANWERVIVVAGAEDLEEAVSRAG